MMCISFYVTFYLLWLEGTPFYTDFTDTPLLPTGWYSCKCHNVSSWVTRCPPVRNLIVFSQAPCTCVTMKRARSAEKTSPVWIFEEHDTVVKRCSARCLMTKGGEQLRCAGTAATSSVYGYIAGTGKCVLLWVTKKQAANSQSMDQLALWRTTQSRWLIVFVCCAHYLPCLMQFNVLSRII